MSGQAASKVVDWQPRGWSAFLENLGFGEMVLIFIVALVVFGPQKLPELGKSVGTAMREFRKATRELTEDFARTATAEVARAREAASIAPAARPAPVPEPAVTSAPAPAAQEPASGTAGAEETSSQDMPDGAPAAPATEPTRPH